MANLLAILMSLALVLTGATTSSLPEAPMGRVMTLGNLEVSHNGEDAALDLYATLGVTADADQALYDFSIGDASETYLPFQLAVTENSLLLKNDKDGQTLVITPADVEKLIGDTLGGENMDIGPLLDAYAGMLPAYADLMSIMRDADEMETMSARCWEIYGKMVERGEGVPGKVEYDGDLYDVMTYEYTLNGAQIGALADAIYATDERLMRYKAAYLNMLSQLPEGMGISGADSFEALSGKQNITLRMSESIAENGLVMMDGKLTVVPPAMTADENAPRPEPISYNIHQARMDNDEYSTVTFDMPTPYNGLILSTYVEYSRDDRDSHTTVTVTGNPEDGSAVGEDGEGDGEDALYITLDYDIHHDADTDMTERDASATLDATGDTHIDFSLEAEHDAEGAGDSHIACTANIGKESYALDFDVVVTNETVERRVTGEGAVSLEEYSFPALLSNLTEDFSQLMNSADVQTLAGMFTQTPPATEESTAPEAPYEEEPEESPADSSLPFASPRFDWLPEGYTVDDITVDEQYDDVTCTLVNPETGSTITVDLTSSGYPDGGMNHYILKDESFKALDGLLISEEDYEDYFVYTADDGQVSYLIYPDSKDVPATDILNLIIGLHF